MTFTRRWSGGGLVACVLGAAFTVEAAGRPVTLRAEDGRTINAYLADADARPAAAVVLVPMLGRPKEDWQAIADRFAAAGISAVAIDLPGEYAPDDPRALAGWARDVSAAVGFLAARPEVRPGAIGIAGASLGASLAAVAAAADSRVRSIALVSPSLEYRGLRIEGPMRQLADRPALLMASLRDPYAARTVRDLGKNATAVREVHLSETVAHGTVLLSRDPDLVRTLVEWFQRTLG